MGFTPDDRSTVVWERPQMVRYPDNLKSSKFTWTPPMVFESEKSPMDMALLMQHYYGRAWRIARDLYEEEQAEINALENTFIARKAVMRADQHRKRMVTASQTDKPRFIHPKFRNIPSRTDSGLKVNKEKSNISYKEECKSVGR